MIKKICTAGMLCLSGFSGGAWGALKPLSEVIEDSVPDAVMAMREAGSFLSHKHFEGSQRPKNPAALLKTPSLYGGQFIFHNFTYDDTFGMETLFFDVKERATPGETARSDISSFVACIKKVPTLDSREALGLYHTFLHAYAETSTTLFLGKGNHEQTGDLFNELRDSCALYREERNKPEKPRTAFERLLRFMKIRR